MRPCLAMADFPRVDVGRFRGSRESVIAWLSSLDAVELAQVVAPCGVIMRDFILDRIASGMSWRDLAKRRGCSEHGARRFFDMSVDFLSHWWILHEGDQ